MNSSGTLKIARNGYIVMAVIFCALGIFLMVNPTKAMKIICVLAGILFIADGIIKIIGYFSRDFYCLAFQFDFCHLRVSDPGRCAASYPDVSRSEKIRAETVVGNFDHCRCDWRVRNDSSH